MKRTDKITPYLNEIAERLWNNHASVMIGAGFSKNAESQNAKKRFLTWSELGDIFYQKLNHEGLLKNSDDKYRNILKMANEVEATFGRNVLNQIIKENLPDNEYIPSDLHIKLLKLPWTDVFTTNYDTLLERATNKVFDYRYETVVNKEDLVWSTKPRIIKLHGSFPSQRPFVITEEDYRKYPKDFAVFVNTVQQSLIENTLCLIGFSGNDPNFLNWIGWVRDNLGKTNSTKIYLVGLLNLSIGEEKLLHSRNIIPIDLSYLCSGEVDDKYALNEFFKYLKNKRSTYNKQISWSTDEYPTNDKTKLNIVETIEKLRKIREGYPGWIILPYSRRIYLNFDVVHNNNIGDIKNFEVPYDIEYLYEINWQLEKQLCPIIDNWEQYYEFIINKYNPFPDIILNNALINPKTKDYKKLNWEQITSFWIELNLSILRSYRENGLIDKWNNVVLDIDKIKDFLTKEQSQRYTYELCLKALFRLDISSLIEKLNSWQINANPYWQVKKAGLLAEIGNLQESEKLLEESLNAVRVKLNLSKNSNDYENLSMEAYILRLLDYVKDSIAGFSFKEREYKKDYSKRLKELTQYECDPVGEYRAFETRLSNPITIKKETEEKVKFDIGEKIITTHWGNNNETLNAFYFLRYLEEIGLPFRINKQIANNTIESVLRYFPSWAFVSFIRNGANDEESLNRLFNRKTLTKYTQNDVDNLIKQYLEILQKSENAIKDCDTLYNRELATRISSTIPELLSRLCTKASFEIKLELLEFIKQILMKDMKNKYKGLLNLSKRLINSLSCSEQYNLLSDLLEFPIIAEDDIRNEDFDIFQFILINKAKTYNKVIIKPLIIENLINFISKDNTKRFYASSRLYKLMSLDLLSTEHINLFAEKIWEYTDKFGFPNIGFYYYTYLYFKNADISKINNLLSEYFNNSNFPIQEKNNNTIVMNNSGTLYMDNLIGTANTKKYIWTEQNLTNLVNKIILWWDSNKNYLKHEGKDIVKLFKRRYEYLPTIIIKIVSPNIKFLPSEKIRNIYRIVSELQDYDISSLDVRASLKLYDGLFNDIEKTIYSRNYENIEIALCAIQILKEQDNDITQFIKIIILEIKSRNSIALQQYIRFIANIFEKQADQLTEEFISDLALGLDYLVNETEILEEDTDKEVDDKIQYRIYIAKLVKIIKEYYKNKQQPEYIYKWEKIYSNKDEFSEIRNAWLDF